MYNITDIRDKLPVNEIRLKANEKIPKRTKAIERIVIHCSDFKDRFDTEDVFKIAKYDVTPSPTNHLSQLGAFTISYHYFIEYFFNEIVIYKCLDNDIVSWHAKGWNNTSLAIAVNKLGKDVDEELRKRAIWLAALKCQELRLKPDLVFGHKELKGTGWDLVNGQRIQIKTCPGNWDMNKFREDVYSIMEGGIT